MPALGTLTVLHREMGCYALLRKDILSSQVIEHFQLLGAKLYSTVVLRWFSLPNPRDIENPGWTGAFTALEGREGIPVLTEGGRGTKDTFLCGRRRQFTNNMECCKPC